VPGPWKRDDHRVVAADELRRELGRRVRRQEAALGAPRLGRRDPSDSVLQTRAERELVDAPAIPLSPQQLHRFEPVRGQRDHVRSEPEVVGAPQGGELEDDEEIDRLERGRAGGVELGQLAVAAVVAGGVDDRPGAVEVLAGGDGVVFGEAEAGEAEVGVGFVEAEAAAFGKGEGFVEVAVGEVVGAGVGVKGGAGEEAEEEVLLDASAAQPIDRGCEMRCCLGEIAGDTALNSNKVGAAEGQMIERDVLQQVPHFGPRQCLRGAAEHIGVPALVE
jgi:hypothetical protein